MNLKHLGALQPIFFFKWALSSPVQSWNESQTPWGSPAQSKIEILQRPGGSQVSWFALSSKLFGLSSPVVFDSDFKSYGLSSPDVLWVLQHKYQGAIQPKPPAMFSSHSFLWGCAVCVNLKKIIGWYRPSAGKRGWYSLYYTWPPQIGWVSQKTKIICLMVC